MTHIHSTIPISSGTTSGTNNTSYFAGPTSRSLHGSTVQLPPVPIGATNPFETQSDPPGPWAHIIMGMNFTVGVCGGRDLKTEHLKAPYGRPQQREPVLRHRRVAWSPTRMHELIGQSVHRLEAAAMQVVGTESLDECKNCRRDQGPFVKCVFVVGIPGCANCHWAKEGERCSMNAQPVPRKPGTKRHTGSQTIRLGKENRDELSNLLGQIRQKVVRVEGLIHDIQTEVKSLPEIQREARDEMASTEVHFKSHKQLYSTLAIINSVLCL